MKEKEPSTSDKLTAKGRKTLRATDFGIPESREYPMPDAAHVRAAEAYFRYAPEDKKAMLAHRILLKAKKYGVDVESDIVRDWAARYSK